MSIAVLGIVITLAVVAMVIFNQVKPPEKGTTVANQRLGAPQSNNNLEQGEIDQTSPPPERRADTELLEVILKHDISLSDTNMQALVSVARVQKTKNAWYIVTLHHKDPTVTDAKVVLKDNGGSGLVVIAGPGTRFDKNDIYLPSEVWALL